MRLSSATARSALLLAAGCFSSGSSSPIDECYADLIACRKAEVSAWTRPDDKPSWIVSASDLSEHPVTGRMGVPLGKVAAIQATIVAGESMHMKRYDGHYLLRVEAVNGIAPKQPANFEFALAPGSMARLANSPFELHRMLRGSEAHKLDSHIIADLEKDYVGKTLQLEAYETGSFRGIPKALPAGVDTWQDISFQFETYLMVLRERGRP